MNQRTLLGLLLSCTPLPICLFWEHLPRNMTLPELTARIALLSGGPAFLLFFGFRPARKSGRLGFKPF